MKKARQSKLYLFLAIGFLILGMANFYMKGFTSTFSILLNIGWLVIGGLYFAQYLKFRKLPK